jgi:hypothetical protein
MRLCKKFMFGLSVGILLTACGGGGGGASAPATTVSFSPNPLSAFCYQTQPGLDYSVAVVATFGGTLPTGTVYAVITFDHPGFTTNIQILQSGNIYTAKLSPDVSLAPGMYTGNVTVHLYKDSSFTSEYPLSGGTLPYTVTVTPAPPI